MKKLLSRIVWLPVGAIMVIFLVANRQSVALSLDPFTPENPALSTIALPLWVWLMFAILIGFFAGATGMWASGRPARKRARAIARELKAMKTEQAARAAAKPASELPALEAHASTP